MAIRKISQINKLESDNYVMGTTKPAEVIGGNTITFTAPQSCLEYILDNNALTALTKEQQKKVKRVANSLFELSFPRKNLDESENYDETEYFDSYSINLSGLQDALGVSEAYEWARNAYNSFKKWLNKPIIVNPILSGEVWLGLSANSGSCSYQTNGYDGQFPRMSGTGNAHSIWRDSISHIHVAAKSDFYDKVIIHSDGSNPTQPDRAFEVDGDSYFHGMIKGRAIQACWADLAELYESDSVYDPGTLVKFGGSKEITVATGNANAVVTQNPGFVLNSDESENGKLMVGIALTGRVKVKVIGPVKKFDKIVLSATPGVGIACNKPEATPQYLLKNDVIGRALEDNAETGVKLIECVVQMNLN